MVQKLDGSHDALKIVTDLIDIILNDALKNVCDRSDMSNEQFEKSKFENPGKDVVEHEDNVCKSRGEEEKNATNVKNCWTDDTCLPTLSEVCVKSSSLSNSSKQGEGDQSSIMREAITFMCLNEETHIKKSQKMNSNSSLNTNTSSTDEIIQSLQNEINNLSFDSILLSDSETDEGGGINSKYFTDSNLETTSIGFKKGHDNGNSEKLADDQIQIDENVSNSQNAFPQSHKFCQYNNIQYFPHNILPQNYCQLVDESYNRYEDGDDEEGHRLLSDSSEELVIINGEDEKIPSQEYVAKHTYEYPSTCSVTPSSTKKSPRSPRPSTSRDASCSVEVNENIELPGYLPNWEENNEVQVKVIVPTEILEEEDNVGVDDVGLDDVTKTAQYRSNLGLTEESVMDPKYFRPIEEIEVIQTIKVLNVVKEEKTKKKRNFMARVASLLPNMFKCKHHRQKKTK